MSFLKLDEDRLHKPVTPQSDPILEEADRKLETRKSNQIDAVLVLLPIIGLFLWAATKGGVAWGIGASIVPTALFIGGYGIARKITGSDPTGTRVIFIFLAIAVFYLFTP